MIKADIENSEEPFEVLFNVYEMNNSSFVVKPLKVNIQVKLLCFDGLLEFNSVDFSQ